jgi:hypothetical protein
MSGNVNLRANWDVEEDWKISSVKWLLLQKRGKPEAVIRIFWLLYQCDW